MSIADEVANLVEENRRLRAALAQVVNAISGAAEALQGNGPAPKNETPVVTEVPEPEPEPEPEEEKVERRGVSGGAYRVNAGDVLGGRMI
jgi:hypothetical protein